MITIPYNNVIHGTPVAYILVNGRNEILGAKMRKGGAIIARALKKRDTEGEQ
jgi:hypothetical protein